jgi:hypothetical protein
MNVQTIEVTENRRTVELNSNKIHFDRKDPYGFWFVHYDKGQVPASLQGAFTSFDRALLAVSTYLETKKPEKAEKKIEKKSEAA